MPSTSKKQANFMQAVAHNPAFAKKVGVKQSVGKDFAEADKGKTFKKGGIPADINKQKTHHTDGGVPNYSVNRFAGLKGGGMAESKAMEKREMEFLRKKGASKSMVKHEEKEMKTEKFSAGGVTKKLPTSKQMGNLGMKSGGSVKEARMEPAKMGKVARMDAGPAKKESRMAPAKMERVKTSSSKDGIASKGRTNTKYC